MYFKQFYLGCLAHASYLLGSAGVAAVIDPQRDVDQYLEEAAAQGLQVKYVIETHLHADFVSGHRELAERAGAEIVFGAKAGATFPHRAVKEGDEIKLGKLSLRVLETPGHTPEGVSILAVDTEKSEQPARLFTGDTLFIGDVGRPDLVGSKGYTAEQMAGLLYDSLHEKLLKLPDEVEVYPAHGAGSLCGRNLSSERMSTIGEQKKYNYALKPMTKAAFIKLMTTDLPETPDYFSQDVEINRTGATTLEDLPRPAALRPIEVQRLRQLGHVILDVRRAAAYGAGHVPGSLNIGLGGQFAPWAGTLISMGTSIILVAADLSQIDEAVMRLARVGLESVKGYLDGGIYAWDKAGLPVAQIAQMPVDELKSRLAEQRDLQVIDVRRPGEYASGRVPGAISAPLNEIADHYTQFDPKRPTAVVCGSGYRSSAAASLLETRGFTEIYDIVGGTAAWLSADYPVETDTTA